MSGFWTMMSSGSWLSQNPDYIGTEPGHFGVWEKFQLGWLNYEVAFAGQKSEHKMGPAETNTKQAQGLFVVLPPKAVTEVIADPYSGRQLTAFPAINCDVAVIHVLKADPSGTSVLGGNPTVDRELAAVARTTIITAEEIVDHFNEQIDIPGQDVAAVVHCPRGAWPTSCYPLYPIDGEEILRYISACNHDGFQAYIDAA